jgi:hypothetical protein
MRLWRRPPGAPPPPETVLGIFDLRGFTSANADWTFVRFLVDIFFYYYPKVEGRLRYAGRGWRCVAVPPAWGVVKCV